MKQFLDPDARPNETGILEIEPVLEHLVHGYRYHRYTVLGSPKQRNVYRVANNAFSRPWEYKSSGAA